MGGPEVSETQQSSGPPPWMQPYIMEYLNRAGGASLTPFEAYPGQTVARLPGQTEAGLEMMGARAVNDPTVGAALDEYGRTVSGGYLGSNPYLDEAYQAAARATADQYKYATAPSSAAAASRAGALGGSAYNELRQQQEFGLGQNLSDLAARMYGGAYEAERGRQTSALGMAPQIAQTGYLPSSMLMQAGGVRRDYEQQLLDAVRNQWMGAQEYPYKMLDVLGSAIGTTLVGEEGTTTTQGFGK